MLALSMVQNRLPNLPRMAEAALRRLGRPTELAEIYDHVRTLGFEPASDLVGIAELGTALYRNRDRFTPITEDTWSLVTWDEVPEVALPQPPALTESIRSMLAREGRAVMLKTIANRLRRTTHPDVTVRDVLDVLKGNEEFELVSPGRYALRGAAPNDPLLDLWLPPEPAPEPSPRIEVSDDDVARMVLLLSHFDRLMAVDELAQAAVELRHWREPDALRAQAIVDSAPTRFLLIKGRYYGLAEWEGSAKALLFGSGWQRALAGLIHEYLRRRRGEDVESLVMTLGNDPRWPLDAPKTIKAVQALLDRYDHVFMRITRRRADGGAEAREVWTLQPYAREAEPIAPRPLSLKPTHPLGPGVPLDMPHPNPLIRSEVARLAHVALRHLGRSASVEEIVDLMITKLKWSSSGDARQVTANTLARRKDLFRKVRAGRYALRR